MRVLFLFFFFGRLLLISASRKTFWPRFSNAFENTRDDYRLIELFFGVMLRSIKSFRLALRRSVSNKSLISVKFQIEKFYS